MLFAKRLRSEIQQGRITQSVRIWTRPHVTVGHRYAMADGEIEVDSVQPIEIEDVTDALARACGFRNAIDMLGIAQHGKGSNVYLIRFHYVGPREAGTSGTPPARRGARGVGTAAFAGERRPRRRDP
jgi:hypothetical protein